MNSHVVDVEQFQRELTLLCFQLKQDDGKATPDAIEHVRCLMQLLGDCPDVIVASNGDSLTTSYLKEFWHNVPWFEEIRFGSKYIAWGNEWPRGRAFADLSESTIAWLDAAVLSLRDSIVSEDLVTTSGKPEKTARGFPVADAKIPGAFVDSHGPIGPLVGNITAICQTLTPGTKRNRAEDMLKRQDSGELFFREMSGGRFEVYYNSRNTFSLHRDRGPAKDPSQIVDNQPDSPTSIDTN